MERVSRAVGDQNTAVILNELFDRLYVLRNQIMHEGATWQSSVNRNQVRDGAAIMAFLTPRLVKLMMDNPAVDWGVPHYPLESPEWSLSTHGGLRQAL